ncbi:hypothetical protein K491DRAFT_715172 [Lophiostoma macrostomum CBS 122681]|uniref:Uncharacterized protein n=1 Tax=Lophiostoma macrostomum CBS 122681 TaxID=1314788 RepID=A0A6A6TBE9_9PLEO|nr:hypothetical protein K491DRAFT_715172 [Lophiostoma macrostomum CBS 122681]
MDSIPEHTFNSLNTSDPSCQTPEPSFDHLPSTITMSTEDAKAKLEAQQARFKELQTQKAASLKANHDESLRDSQRTPSSPSTEAKLAKVRAKIETKLRAE